MIAAGPRARAHHVVSAASVSPVEPRSMAELEAESGSFSLAGASGDWQVLAVAGEMAWRQTLSLRARLPVARIDFDDGRTVMGLADADLSAKVRLFASPHGAFIVAAGAGLEVPTGDEDRQLGGGHFELGPFVGASSEHPAGPGRLVLATQATDRIALDRDEAAGPTPRHGPLAGDLHGSPIAPHTDHELVISPLASYVWRGAHAGLGADAIVPFAGGDPCLDGRLAAGAAIGAARLSAAFELPLAGDGRFGWRARAGIGWVF